jgi:TolB-like protein/Flp pilus assembly protein TadD
MIQLHTLGVLDLRDSLGDELRTVLAQPKRLALLAYLAVVPARAHPRREIVISLFWPTLDEHHARGALRQALRFLRKSLDTDVLEASDDEGIRVRHDALWCDATEFERRCQAGRYAEALELYRGTFLEGLSVAEAPELSRWLDLERARYGSTAFAAARTLCGRCESERDLVGAVAWGRRAVLLQAYDEPACRRLIALLDMIGDRAGAVRAYEDFAHRLEEDYDVEPSAETRALVRKVRTQSWLVDARERTASEPPIGGGVSLRSELASIAVLPFQDATGETENQYFSEGMSDEVMSALGKVGTLRVAPRSSSYAVGSFAVDPRTIRERLGVDVVLEGTVRRARDRLRVAVRLTNAVDGSLIWAQTFDREHDDLFTVQDEITQTVLAELRVARRPLSSGQVVHRPTTDLDAYNSYLKGRYYWNKRPRETMKGLAFFERAIARDPLFALAHAGLADCYATLGSWEGAALQPREAFPRAQLAATRALEIDPTLGEAHATLAFVATHHRWRWGEADEAFERAFTLNSSYPHTYHWYAHHLMIVGQFDEALAAIVRSRELDPLDVIINGHFAWHFWLTRQYEESIEAAHRTLEIDPHDHWAPYYLGLVYGQQGMFDEAISEHRKAVPRSGGSGVMLAALGCTYAAAGKCAEAREILRRLEELSRHKHVSAYEIGVIHLALGDTERAFLWLGRALEERSAWLPYLRVDPRLDAVRQDSRYLELVASLGFPIARGCGDCRA